MILYNGQSLAAWTHCTIVNTGSELITLEQLQLQLQLELLDDLKLDQKLHFLELELEPKLEVETLELQLSLIWRGGWASMLDWEPLQGKQLHAVRGLGQARIIALFAEAY